MKELKFTKTATFLFPLLQVPKSLFDCDIKDRFNRYIHNTRFINAYLSDSNISKYVGTEEKDYVFVVIRNYQDVDFANFQSTFRAFPNYVDDYDYRECFVIVFTVPEARKEDFALVKRGAYSELSTDGKRLILANNFYSGKPYTLPLILNKAQSLKDSWEERLTFIGPDIYSPADLGDQEVWPVINPEKEVLTPEITNSLNKKQHLMPSEEF